jgi:DUF2924 family protein
MTLSKALSAAQAPTDPSLAREIDALRQMAVPELVARYSEVFGKPPRIKHKAFLWKRISWRIQEQRYGGLSEVAKARLEELISEIDLPLEDQTRTVSGVLRRPPRPGNPSSGTTLTRSWRGQQIAVRVLEDGKFEWNGTVFRSLSAIASSVTGVRWNGPAWFGLREGKPA